MLVGVSYGANQGRGTAGGEAGGGTPSRPGCGATVPRIEAAFVALPRPAWQEQIMDTLRQQVAAKKAELDRLRARSPGGLGNLEHVHDLELTYTSNAIEGNTLTAAETTHVVEHGVTIGGKPLKDHLEAIDHYEAIRYVLALDRQGAKRDGNGRAARLAGIERLAKAQGEGTLRPRRPGVAR